MKFDWTVTFGSLLTLAGFVISIIVAYYTMQRDIDARLSAMATKVDKQFSDLNVRLAEIFEGDIRELRGRIVELEIGHKSIVKELVDRSHKLSDEVNLLLMKVDRLERPHGDIRA